MMTVENMKNYDLDSIDKKILELLQEDAKMTIKDISNMTGKSQTAVRERIKKLEDNLIKKYAAIIDCRQLGYREMVMASLRINSSQPLEDIKSKVDKIAEIKYAYVTTGEYPIFLMFKCLGHEQALSVIDKLRNLPGVEEVKTEIVLDRIKEDHSIIIT